MSEQKQHQLGRLLAKLEQELKYIALWDEVMPEAEALASEEPFCIDTLDLSQWLQWIFIPKMSYLLDQSMPLPNFCGIHEVAEEAFKGMDTDIEQLLSIVYEIDRVISEP